ncbi:hypothetical protein MPER_06619 [Moniliophthora perniciosa FA553]|nr:hypothetical protein MPER_06619 [Moniliophthora perniciosa FA553]
MTGVGPFAGAVAFPSPSATLHPIPRTLTPQKQSPGASPVPSGPAPPYPEPQGPGEDHRRETGTLLSPGTFKATDSSIRDSAISDGDRETKQIPIEWTGTSSPTSPKPETNRMSSVPMLPGAWQSTPTEEKDSGVELEEGPGTKTPIHDANIHVASPEITEQGRVKSEVAEMGVIPPPGPPPPLPQRQVEVPPSSSSVRSEDKDKGKVRDNSGSGSGSGSGQGWVLVNVESPAPLTPSTPPVAEHEPSSSSSAETDPHDTNALKKPTSENASMSPAAKAIVIIDAVDAKKDKKTQDAPKGRREGEDEE